jgi:4-amino-4-deoxy-L-arabinose transferase-like glycosyltransferase
LASPDARAWLVALLTGLAAFAAGTDTDLSLGDENYHFHKAVEFFQAGGRTAYATDYGPIVPPGIRYHDGPLWEWGLARLWQLTGRSVVVAQAYQAFWYTLIVGFAWMAGKRLGGPAVGWWALLLATTMPAILLFGGILLYVEGAMVALLMLSAVLLLSGRPLLAGAAFGLAFLAKPSVAVVFPALVTAAALATDAPWRRRLAAATWAVAGVAALVLPDLWWRHVHDTNILSGYLVKKASNTGVPAQVVALWLEPGLGSNYQTTTLLNPLDVLTHLGLPVLLGVALSIIGLVQKRDRTVLALWALAASVLLPQAILAAMHMHTEVRYIMPIFVALILVAALALARMLEDRRWLTGAVVAAALAQALSVGGFACVERRVSPEFVEAVQALGRLPSRGGPGFVLCPEAKVSTYSGRPILWSAVNPGAFFFTWPSEKQGFLLDYYGVQYIAVPRSRIYDDTAAKHTGGYPRSFVEALPRMPYVDPFPVIDGPWMIVYRVKSKPASEAPSR